MLGIDFGPRNYIGGEFKFFLVAPKQRRILLSKTCKSQSRDKRRFLAHQLQSSTIMSKIVQEKMSAKEESVATAGQEERDNRGYLVLQGKELYKITPYATIDDAQNDLGRPFKNRVPYLERIRGVLGLQTLLWIFFRFFAPANVTDTDVDGLRPAVFVQKSPEWMTILRKVLSPLLFDGSLQMAGFIILMGRASLQTFVERRAPRSLAGDCILRPVRLLFPIALSFALSIVLAATSGYNHAPWLAERLNNQALTPPEPWSSTVLYFNSLVTFFLFAKDVQR